MHSRLPVIEVLVRLISVCAACLTAACAWAAAAQAADLEVVGGDSPRTVQLQLCPEGPAGSRPERACVTSGEGPYQGGRLTIRVRGASAGETLTVGYLRDGVPATVLSYDHSEPVFLLKETQIPLTATGEQPLDVAVGFTASPGESPSTLSGSLVVAPATGKPASVPVTAEARSFSGIAVSPATLSIDGEDPESQLMVEGPELDEYLQLHGQERLSTTLRGNGDDTAEATLSLPQANGTTHAAATVAVTADEVAAGKYSGRIALPEVPAEGGAASIELHEHESFALLVALVLAGVVFVGIGTRLVTAAGRRKQLGAVLDQSYDAYAFVAETGETKSWRLDDLLGMPPVRLTAEQKKAASKAEPEGDRLQGLQALRHSIATARSAQDLDEDATRVLDMVGRMQRWLRLEPLARRLALVEACKGTGTLPEEGEGEDRKDPRNWADSSTLRDTRAIQAMARREPADADKADELVARLAFQIDWHNRMAVAWEAADRRPELAKPVRKLDEALDGDDSAEERKLGELSPLTARLDALIGELPEDTPVPDPPEVDEKAISDCGGELGLTKVDWEASPHLFTGWATLDAQSYGQLGSRAATSSRGQYMPGAGDLLHEMDQLKPADFYWTAAILAVASAAYSVSAYNDTWGSGTDLATAFLAGALGKVAVNWAALPIFQSVRLRKAAKD